VVFEKFHHLQQFENLLYLCSFVSIVHLLVGVYCLVFWAIDLPKHAVCFNFFMFYLALWLANVSYDNFIDIFCMLVSMKFLRHISECSIHVSVYIF